MRRFRGACILVSLAASAPAQLSGLHTINAPVPLPGVTNHPSLTSAVNALSAQGVGGPVVFEMFDDAGPYTDQVAIPTTTWTPNNAVALFGHWNGTSAANTVTFRAAQGEYPVLDATGRGFGIWWYGADFVVLEGLEIRGAANDGILMWTSNATGTATAGNIIRRCIIHGCGAGAVSLYGNPLTVDDTVIENCVFYDCELTWHTATGFQQFGRFGYFCQRRALRTVLRGNTFFMDGGNPANTQLCAIGDNPAALGTVSLLDVRDNLFVETPLVAANAIWLGTNSAGPATMDWNAFHLAGAGTFSNLAGAGTLAAWQALTGRDTHSIAGDPVLIDPYGALGARDFHIAPTSPCRNAGTAIPGFTTDFEGQLRDACPDIGADEVFTGALTFLVGPGCAGTGGVIPQVGITGCAPTIGNAAFGFQATQARPGAPGAFVLSLATASIPVGPCTLSIDLGPGLVLLLPIQASASGDAAIPLPVPSNIALVGVTGYAAFGWADPTAQSGLGVSFTATLGVTIGT